MAFGHVRQRDDGGAQWDIAEALHITAQGRGVITEHDFQRRDCSSRQHVERICEHIRLAVGRRCYIPASVWADERFVTAGLYILHHELKLAGPWLQQAAVGFGLATSSGSKRTETGGGPAFAGCCVELCDSIRTCTGIEMTGSSAR